MIACGYALTDEPFLLDQPTVARSAEPNNQKAAEMIQMMEII